MCILYLLRVTLHRPVSHVLLLLRMPAASTNIIIFTGPLDVGQRVRDAILANEYIHYLRPRATRFVPDTIYRRFRTPVIALDH